MEILEDIHPLMELYQRNAKILKSFWALANVKWFQAKVALKSLRKCVLQQLLQRNREAILTLF
jgi:hypothetical protein